jgi:predicted DNA-binding transcriptional regulator YafY
VAAKDWMDGTGRVTMDVEATGRSVNALKSKLQGQMALQLRDGAILDTITFDSERWLEDEVIKYRGDAVLIEPAALRARVARRATQILKEVKGAKRLASKSRR